MIISKVSTKGALLCFFADEDGAEQVGNLLDDANKSHYELLLSVVNLAEVYYTIERRERKQR